MSIAEQLPETCPASVYHAFDAVSASRLKVFAKSRQEYYERFVAKSLPEKEPSPAMLLGTLCHAMTLEWGEFDARYVIKPQCDRRTKEGKALYDSFAAMLNGRELISEEQYVLAESVAKAVVEHDIAGEIIGPDSRNEHSIHWTDAETGLQCKSRRDLWRSDLNILADLKTTADACPDAFVRHAENLGYYRQAAWYIDGHKLVYGVEPRFAFIVVATEAPHEVGVYELHEDWIEAGRKENRALLDQLAECHASGDWLNPWSKSAKKLERPNYGSYKSQYQVED